MPTDNQLADRISAFVTELDALVRKTALEALRGLLDGTSTSARPGRPAGRRRGPGRPRGSANVEGASDAILAHVRANDGQTVGEIVQGAGVAPKAAKKAIIGLLASGALKKSGQKRGTRYHVGSGRAPRRKAGKRRGRRAKKA